MNLGLLDAFNYALGYRKGIGEGIAGVATVNSRSGIVTLTKSDVGLSNVTNTSDANKPVSTAQQTALDLKADAADLGTAAALDVDTDVDLAADSDTLIPTQKAVKAYVDANAGGGGGDVAGDTHAATGKTTPADADELPIVDSAASNVLKKLTWANLKATIKTYTDTLYQTILVSGTSIKTVNGSSLLGSGNLSISASAAGSDKQITFNDGGSSAGDAGLLYDKTAHSLGIGVLDSDTVSTVNFSGSDGSYRPVFGYQASQTYAKAMRISFGTGPAAEWNHYTGEHILGGFRLSFAADKSSSADAGIARVAAAQLEVNDGTAGGGASLRLNEMASAPSAPAANKVVFYAEDNGSGKTRVMALFATGSAVQIAIEP